MNEALLQIPCVTLDGQTRTLDSYAAKALLVVNTASRCGFTPQYKALETLWQRYRDRGLVVLGFPCNQFGHQEPGDSEEIQSFCELNYGVSFPLFAKVEVNGANAHPLFEHLKHEAPGLLGTRAIKWNFTKFLVDTAQGRVTRFSPKRTPESLGSVIERLLA